MSGTGRVFRCFFLVLTLFATTAGATEVYKWVDENGRTHYGEKPPQENAEKVELRDAPRTPEEVEQYNRDRDKLLQVMEEERLQKQEEKREAEEKRQALADKCDRIEKRLAGLQRGGVFYSKDDNGERVYLTEEEITAEIGRLQDARDKLCR